MRKLLFYPTILCAMLSSSLAQNSDKVAVEHFDRYLAKCPDGEIRCVWFLNGSVRVGMVMRLSLTEYEVHTVREVHDFAHQGSKIRKLSHPQVKTLKEILMNMPKSSDSNDRLNLVYVSFQKDGQLKKRKYLRSKIPRKIERIYDIGGGFLETREQGGGG